MIALPRCAQNVSRGKNTMTITEIGVEYGVPKGMVTEESRALCCKVNQPVTEK